MYRVIKRFNDRITGERHEVGDRYTGDRGEELARKGRVEWRPEEPPRGPMGRFMAAGRVSAGTDGESTPERARTRPMEPGE